MNTVFRKEIKYLIPRCSALSLQRKLDKIMDGDIQEILDALIAADQAAKLAKMNSGG